MSGRRYGNRSAKEPQYFKDLRKKEKKERMKRDMDIIKGRIAIAKPATEEEKLVGTEPRKEDKKLIVPATLADIAAVTLGRGSLIDVPKQHTMTQMFTKDIK